MVNTTLYLHIMLEHLDDYYVNLFSTLIYNQSGIHFSKNNRSILENRLRERLKTLKLDDIRTYYDIIIKDPEEMKVLLDSVTTNLTRFFRNKGHFQTLEHFVIPNMVAYKRERGANHIKVWSAGCASGEEPYSIAMVLKEHLPLHFTAEIIASDLSLTSLLIAREGFYNEARVSDVPLAYLRKYFEKKPDGYKIIDSLKNMIRFDYHNLKSESGLKNIDILFCRNVIIYFDEAAQKSLITRFWETMAGFSYLILGHSESLFGMNTPFEFVKTDWSCIYKKIRLQRTDSGGT
jgi:chemotaxis protein methyltransferase CheR